MSSVQDLKLFCTKTIKFNILIAIKKAFNLFSVINVSVRKPNMQNIEFEYECASYWGLSRTK